MTLLSVKLVYACMYSVSQKMFPLLKGHKSIRNCTKVNFATLKDLWPLKHGEIFWDTLYVQ